MSAGSCDTLVVVSQTGLQYVPRFAGIQSGADMEAKMPCSDRLADWE